MTITFDIGQRFGLGVIISCLGVRPDDKSRSRWWLLQCDCGNKYERTAGYLRQGQKSPLTGRGKSCGCYNNKRAAGKESRHWKGYRDIPLTFFTGVQWSAKRHPRRKPIEFSIMIEDVSSQWEKQKGKCIYTGEDLTFGVRVRDPKHPSHKKRTASLDRIDSSKGYVLGNIEFCHKHINMMKQSFEKGHFIKMCKLVAGWGGD